ncbi:MAG: DUF4118 domain-containing protein [Rhodospirillales bacterium]|nr:MAG: DUF4118 domain-containing protein [Rhodospirillales bacterium]
MAAVAVSTAIGELLTTWLPPHNAALVFIVGVLACAARFGTWSGVAAAVLAFLAFNFCFIEPRFTLAVSDPRDAFALVVFLVVAVLAGGLAGRLRDEGDAARRRAAMLQTLSDFSGRVATASTSDQVAAAIADGAAAAVRGAAAVFARRDGGVVACAVAPAGETVGPADVEMADRALRQGRAAAVAAAGWPGSRFEFRPMVTAAGAAVVVAVAPRGGGRAVPADGERTLVALLRQGAVALDRLDLARQTADARADVERERLRSALLSSISHDLRTPLSTILGSVTSLRQLGDRMPAEARADLLAAIEEETGRLGRFVTNLLDMTRLDAGLVVGRDWVDVGDLAASVVARARAAHPGATLRLAVAPDAPMVEADAALLAQALENLVENAVKFASRDGPVEIGVSSAADGVVISVTDNGPGIPAERLARVFDKFHSTRPPDGAAPGAGLGLAICRGVVEAMGGRVVAVSPVEAGRGTRFVVTLPAPERPA